MEMDIKSIIDAEIATCNRHIGSIRSAMAATSIDDRMSVDLLVSRLNLWRTFKHALEDPDAAITELPLRPVWNGLFVTRPEAATHNGIEV